LGDGADVNHGVATGIKRCRGGSVRSRPKLLVVADQNVVEEDRRRVVERVRRKSERAVRRNVDRDVTDRIRVDAANSIRACGRTTRIVDTGGKSASHRGDERRVKSTRQARAVDGGAATSEVRVGGEAGRQ